MSGKRQIWRILRPLALVAGVVAGLISASAADRATIVLSSPEKASELSLVVLKKELAIIPDLNLDLTWITPAQITMGVELQRPIQIRLIGRCDLAGAPLQNSRQRGPFAWAHVSDGRVLPFIDVDCDRIRNALFSTMWGEDFQHRDFLLGRALARIIAHELHHVVNSEVHHSEEGLAQPRLTAASLIRGDAKLYTEFNDD